MNGSFPIPVVALGPGTQIEDDGLNYITMPTSMNTFRPPLLPEPEDLMGHGRAREVISQLIALLELASAGQPGGQINLMDLSDDDRALINQVLGEGEASARIGNTGDTLQVQIQESIFTGVWRQITLQGTLVIDDVIEVGPVPAALGLAAASDVTSYRSWDGPIPPNVQNAPLLVDEILDHVQQWSSGKTAHVINLSLLPVTPEDIAFLDYQLGTGRVLILSRGYGNCRITNTQLPNCWRIVYYNSLDKVILNTVEVCEMPEVAMAAVEDFKDSRERLTQVIGYLESV